MATNWNVPPVKKKPVLGGSDSHWSQSGNFVALVASIYHLGGDLKVTSKWQLCRTDLHQYTVKSNITWDTWQLRNATESFHLNRKNILFCELYLIIPALLPPPTPSPFSYSSLQLLLLLPAPSLSSCYSSLQLLLFPPALPPPSYSHVLFLPKFMVFSIMAIAMCIYMWIYV